MEGSMWKHGEPEGKKSKYLPLCSVSGGNPNDGCKFLEDVHSFHGLSSHQKGPLGTLSSDTATSYFSHSSPRLIIALLLLLNAELLHSTDRFPSYSII